MARHGSRAVALNATIATMEFKVLGPLEVIGPKRPQVAATAIVARFAERIKQAVVRSTTMPRLVDTRPRSKLPTGTVTFLFSDIEGSTRLAHRLRPEVYRELLA